MARISFFLQTANMPPTESSVFNYNMTYNNRNHHFLLLSPSVSSPFHTVYFMVLVASVVLLLVALAFVIHKKNVAGFRRFRPRSHSQGQGSVVYGYQHHLLKRSRNRITRSVESFSGVLVTNSESYDKIYRPKRRATLANVEILINGERYGSFAEINDEKRRFSSPGPGSRRPSVVLLD